MTLQRPFQHIKNIIGLLHAHKYAAAIGGLLPQALSTMNPLCRLLMRTDSAFYCQCLAANGDGAST
jgi:hypothetical protein